MAATRRLAATAVFALLLVAPPLAGPLRADEELRALGGQRSAGPPRSEAARKIVSHLRAVVEGVRAEGITTANAAGRDVARRFSSPLVRIDDAARVHVYVTVTDATDAGLAVLRGHGLDVEIVNDRYRIVQGWIPVENLEALAAEPVVVIIRPPSYATRRTGSVNSQGDALHRCAYARAAGFTGAGVSVGVISDGVDGRTQSQATGDLPGVTVLAAGSGDEGTAMLEIVHDCAPGATLLFHTGFPSSLAFIAAVNNLRASGAKIIVDDLGFFSEPFFEDGAIADNDRAVSPFALRVSAAGNSRATHYAGTFTPGVADAQVGGIRHRFAGTDSFLRFRVAAGGTATFILQWGNPFGAAGDDYDLCIRQTTGALVACSNAIQNGNDDPIEAIGVGCPAPAGTFCAGDVQITLFSGVARPLKMFCLGSCLMDEFVVAAGSIIGHPAVPEVLAVAASPAGSSGSIEPFSSAGPVTILFPSAETRAKPDVTGIDGVATSRPGFNPFFGTSAAAPHVAAVAAILAQGQPALTPPQLGALVKNTALNMGAAGFDVDSGFGRADALTAFAGPPFDLDNRADRAIFDATGLWRVFPSAGGVGLVAWGAPALGDVAVPADYDGDGRGDIAVFRTTTGTWFILGSSGAISIVGWGGAGLDVPVPADYDGDMRDDIAVFRLGTGTWFILNSNSGTLTQVAWGGAGLDVPVPADYDGDTRADIAVFRLTTGQWFILRSTDGGLTLVAWGAPALGDTPVAADYDGDGRADIAVFRGTTGEWFILRSTDGGLTLVAWGAPSLGDTPVPADYDGDGRADIAVFRRSTGEWFVLGSATGPQFLSTGPPQPGDQPATLRRR